MFPNKILCHATMQITYNYMRDRPHRDFTEMIFEISDLKFPSHSELIVEKPAWHSCQIGIGNSCRSARPLKV